MTKLKKNMQSKEDIVKILEKKPLLLDGAMGTMLQENGLKSGNCPEEWNNIKPEVVKKIHGDYLKAGSDIMLTNTFGANSIKLHSFQKEKEAIVINEIAVNLCIKAIKESDTIGKEVFVAGSIGPTGGILEPYGNLSAKEVYESYKEQVEALNRAGVDLIVLETFYDLEEIKTALRAVKENSDLMVFASMTFDKNLKTVYGITPEKAVLSLERERADGIGANCGTGPETLLEVLKIMKKVCSKYLLVEPNAGLPELIDGQISYPATPEHMARFSMKFAELGVNIIGGCCGTTPLHIKAISDKIKDDFYRE